jgi:hypothetical protein
MFHLIADENPTRDPVPELEIRSANTDDTAGIVAVWRSAFGEDVFGGPRVIEQWLSWAYDENPSKPPGAPSHKIGLLDGKIVSVRSSQYVFVRVGGDLIPATWGQNLATDAAYQRRGISASMARMRFSGPDLVLAAGRTSAGLASVKSNQRERSRDQFVWPDSAHFGVFSLRWPKLFRAALGATRHGRWDELRQLLRNGLRLIARSTADDVEVVEVAEFPEATDSLLTEITSDVPAMMERTREKLNWFLRNPRIDLKALVAMRQGKPRGYALIRSDGMILDLLTSRQDPGAFDALMARMIAMTSTRGASVLTGIVPSVPWLRSLYEHWGFVVDARVNFGFSFQFYSGARDSRLEQSSNWYLSMSDCDLWSFRAKI